MALSRIALAFLAASLFLEACSASEIRRIRQEELQRLHVGAAVEAPSVDELGARLGEAETADAAGLAFYAYELDYNQQKAVHGELKRAAAAKDGSSVRGGEAAYWDNALRGAGQIGTAGIGLLLFLMVDAPVSYAILASEDEEPPDWAAGRRALFVYDAAGNYRWEACCLEPPIFDDKALRLSALPRPSTMLTAANRPVPRKYYIDYYAIACHRAKLGELTAQYTLFDESLEIDDKPQRFYWAHVIQDNPEISGRPEYLLESVKAGSTEEVIAEAESYYAAHPLEAIDCASFAESIVAAHEKRAAANPPSQ